MGQRIATGVEIETNAPIDKDFEAGKPGRYELRVVEKDVLMSSSAVKILSPAEWTKSFQQRGVPAMCVSVRFAGTTNVRSLNPAQDLLDDLVGRSHDRNVSDNHYVVTVDLFSTGSNKQIVSSMGLGVTAAVGWGIAVGVLIAVSLVFTAISAITGSKNLFYEAVVKIGEAVGDAVGAILRGAGKGAGDAATSLGTPLLIIGGLAILVLVLSKSRVKTKGFGIGGAP